jgi:hypothetical protein
MVLYFSFIFAGHFPHWIRIPIICPPLSPKSASHQQDFLLHREKKKEVWGAKTGIHLPDNKKSKLVVILGLCRETIL